MTLHGERRKGSDIPGPRGTGWHWPPITYLHFCGYVILGDTQL